MTVKKVGTYHLNKLINRVDYDSLTKAEQDLLDDFKFLRSSKCNAYPSLTGKGLFWELTELSDGKCGFCKLRKIIGTGNCRNGDEYWICYKGKMDWYIVQEELKRDGFL